MCLKLLLSYTIALKFEEALHILPVLIPSLTGTTEAHQPATLRHDRLNTREGKCTGKVAAQLNLPELTCQFCFF